MKAIKIGICVVFALCFASAAWAANWFWDVNGQTAGFGDPLTTPRTWDTTVGATTTNWSQNSSGTGATVVWTNDYAGANIAYFFSTNLLGNGTYYNTRTLANPTHIADVVGTQVAGKMLADNGAYVVWTNGAVLFTAASQNVIVGWNKDSSTLHLFSDVIMGTNNIAQGVNRGFTFQNGNNNLNVVGATNNTIIIEGAVRPPDGATNRFDIYFSNYSMGPDTSKIILKPTSVISVGSSPQMNVIFGAFKGNLSSNGRIEVWGTNTYNNSTVILGGTTVAYTDSLSGQAGAFGTGAMIQFGYGSITDTNSAKLVTGVGGITIRKVITVGVGAGNNTTYGVTIGGEQTSGTSTFSGNIALSYSTGYTRTTDVCLTSAAGGTVQFTGAITNGYGGGDTPVNKIGLGTVALNGTNTYSGPTKVSEGTLLVNGILGTGVVTVASGATLGGNGTINGATTVNGTLSAGNSPGMLTFNSDLTLASGSTNYFEINGYDYSEYDNVGIQNGHLTYGGTLVLSIWSGAQVNDTFELFSYLGTASHSGTFDSIVFNDSFDGTFDYDTGVLTVIPEPGTLSALGLGLTAVLLRRRMRKA